MRFPAATAPTWRLLAGADDGEPAPFDLATVDELPAPAQRLLRHALPPGAPLVSAVELEMEGEIKMGSRWMPFHADQILRAGAGFVWRAVVGGRVLRFGGADILGPDVARMEFRFHGLFPLVRAVGPDIARSARGRLAAETVAWLPQALAPQSGARWSAIDDERAVVTLEAVSARSDVEVTVDGDGRLLSVGLQRWNASAKPPHYEPFGARFDTEVVTAAGVRIAGDGHVGWGWGTERWAEGMFFRYRITAVRPP